MVSKLKQCNAETAPKLLDELVKLRFERYVPELVHSLTEATLKTKTSADVFAVVDVLSCLHLRTSGESSNEFTSEIVKQFISNQSQLQEQKLENARQSQQVARLRVFVELLMCGLVSSQQQFQLCQKLITSSKKKAVPREKLQLEGTILALIVQQIIEDDKEKHRNAYLVVTLTSSYWAEMFCDEFLAGQVQKAVQQMINEYYNSMQSRLVKVHQAVQKLNKQKQDYEITRGEVSDKQKSQLEKGKSLFEQLQTQVAAIASVCQFDLPKLQVVDTSEKFTAKVVKDVKPSEGLDNLSLKQWEDLEQKRFYMDLQDLTAFLPKDVLQVRRVKPSKPKQRVSFEEDGSDIEGDWNDDADKDIVDKLTFDKVNVQGPQHAPKTDLEMLIQQLPNSVTKQQIDQWAVDFCKIIVAQGHKAIAALLQTLIDVPRFRLDLLPSYARLVAQLNPFFPSIGSTIVSGLVKEFKSRYRQNYNFNMEHRVKNVRFIGELLKFGVCPSHVFFYCSHRLIKPESSRSTFNQYHVEVYCHLLECCGRFVLYNEEMSPYFRPMLELFERKIKVAGTLDAKVTSMAQNALLAVRPQSEAQNRFQLDQLTPLQLFCQYLIYGKVHVNNIYEVQRLIQSMPWNHPVTQAVNLPWDMTYDQPPPEITFMVPDLLRRLLTEIWNTKFQHISNVAALLQVLLASHEQLVINVVDDVIEEVRSGMINLVHYQYNQRRIMTVKYLSLMHVYNIVDMDVIFGQLNLLVSFGHAKGLPTPSDICIIDPLDNYFRVCLICTLLECFHGKSWKGSLGVFLNKFAVAIQLYWLSKNPETVPVDVKIQYEETLQCLFSKQPRYVSYEDALLALQNGTSQKFQQIVAENQVEAASHNEQVAVSPNVVSPVDSSGSDSDTDDEEEQNQEEDDDQEDEDDLFQAQFASMMTESMQSRRSEKVTVIDAPVPVFSSANATQNDPQQVKFMLLTRKANKSSVKSITMPSESDLVVKTLNQQVQAASQQKKYSTILLQQESQQNDQI